MVLPMEAEDGTFSYLMQFTDGNRIDLTLVPVTDASTYIDADSQTQIKLDKDGLFPEMPAPSDRDYWVKWPSILAFENCCNEFNWVCPYVAKGLWRQEWPFALHMFNHHVWQMMDHMVAWYIGVNTDFQVNCGKYGKYYRHHLNEGLWRQLTACYAGQDEQGLWRALHNCRNLFRSLGREVAKNLGIDYPEDEHARVEQFINRIEQQYWEKLMSGHEDPEDNEWVTQEMTRMTSGLLKLDDVSFQILLRECSDHQIFDVAPSFGSPPAKFCIPEYVP